MATSTLSPTLDVARKLEKALGPIGGAVLIAPVLLVAGIRSLFSVSDGLRYLRMRRM